MMVAISLPADLPPEPQDRWAGAGMTGLEITGLTKRFGDHLVLDDVSIRIEAGAILAVLGPSGGGKTTLLRIVAGFLEPDAGSVSFGGRAS